MGGGVVEDLGFGRRANDENSPHLMSLIGSTTLSSDVS